MVWNVEQVEPVNIVSVTSDVTFHVCMFTVYGVEQAEPVNSDCHNI